jgi:hypothetical protein
MSRSSSGGQGPARGSGLESRILAWLGSYMLAGRPLPDPWAPAESGLTAVGGQTGRPVDDIGAITVSGGQILIQSKAGLELGSTESSALGEALRQVVHQYLGGIPSDPENGTVRRPVDPARDRLVIMTDHSGPATVRTGLVKAVAALAELPDEVAFDELQGDKDLLHARDVLLGHLRREWQSVRSIAPRDADLRGLLRVLRVVAVGLDDEDAQRERAVLCLERVLHEPSKAPAAWLALTTRCHELAEHKHWARVNALRERLKNAQVVFGPEPEHARDIARLREDSDRRIRRLVSECTVPTSNGPIVLGRDIEPLLAGTSGNVALVGGAGCGKTTVALQAAQTLLSDGEDVLYLSGEALAGSALEAQAELGVSALLTTLLRAWHGHGRATLILDGLDVTRFSEPSGWLIELVTSLTGSRWRVVATLRTYTLRYGPRWQAAFAGEALDSSRRDPTLVHVRHLLLEDLTDHELAPLLASGTPAAQLISHGSAVLAGLLHNPFNLKIAADLLTSLPSQVVTDIHTRRELLALYWRHRVADGEKRLVRRRVLARLTEQMVASRRPRVADASAVLDTDLLSSFEDLLSRDVLREDPPVTWTDAVAVGYAHPVLFDFAVAELIFASPADPYHVIRRLDGDPDLAVIARAALDLHFAALWHADPSRLTFWTMACDLDIDARGHALACLAAARTALHEGATSGDLDVLAASCEGRGALRHRTAEAHRLVSQMAGALVAKDLPLERRESGASTLAAVAARLATHARATDDATLARLATMLAHRVTNAKLDTDDAERTANLHRAVIEATATALLDPEAPGRIDIALNVAALLARALIAQPENHHDLVEGLCSSRVLDAWGAMLLNQLLGSLPELAAAAPELAALLAERAWTYEAPPGDTRSMKRSQIMGLSVTFSGTLDLARYTVGRRYPATLESAPTWAIEYFLRMLDHVTPAWGIDPPVGERPRVCQSRELRSAGGYEAFLGMAQALAAHLAGAESGQPASIAALLATLAERLTHHQVWAAILDTGAAHPATLGRALLPLLETGQLLTHHTVLSHSARLITAISPELSVKEHTQLEQRIESLSDDVGDLYVGCLSASALQTPWARERRRAIEEDQSTPPVLGSTGDPAGFTRFPLGDPFDPANASPQDRELLRSLDALTGATTAAYNGGIKKPATAARLRDALYEFLRVLEDRYPAGNSYTGDVYERATLQACRAACTLARDPQLLPGTRLGDRILAILLDNAPCSPPQTSEEAGA